jgi:5-formyltetrahydrofolate cyclo-ligase
MTLVVSDVRAAKARLRARLLARRAARAPAEVVAAGEAVASLASALPPARLVAAYAGVGTEPPTLPLLDRLADTGASVLLPLLLPDADLDWAAYTGPDELRTARLGLREPIGPSLGRAAVASADLVLVPALAVDRAGHRLGRGGGSFDRVLARVAPQTRVVAVLYADEVLDEPLPVEPRDRRVDAALTPLGLVRLRV